jgi:hypothetical protein
LVKPAAGDFFGKLLYNQVLIKQVCQAHYLSSLLAVVKGKWFFGNFIGPEIMANPS